MTLKSVLKDLESSPNNEDFAYLKNETVRFVELLKKKLSKKKVDADVFLGGSFAKGTLAKSKEYDVDVFIRFGWRYVELSDVLEGVLKNVAEEMGLQLDRLHGSRDYFRITKENLTFELIPVVRIKKVREARNVTDLSYFHVRYVKKNLKKKMKKEITLAKKFCKSQGVYGAESYVGGLSGYGLECLIIHYKTFEKMLRALVKVKERIIIDPGRHYKRKDNVLIELNESKLHSPIVLVDPTWKERNVLAALSWETFRLFQTSARKFLARPSKNFFEMKEFDSSRMETLAKKKKAEFVHVVLETNRQEGDIAGTKMKKFSRFLVVQMKRYFEVLDKEFLYSVGQHANFYLVGKPRKEIVRIGPPLSMKKEVQRFKKNNKNTFVKNGAIHSRTRVRFSIGGFLEKFKRDEKNRMIDMSISNLEVSKTL